MMSGPSPAAPTALPQAALGQRPSDAYKRNKKKIRLYRVSEVNEKRSRYPMRGLSSKRNSALPKYKGGLTFSSYSGRSSSRPIRPRMRSITKFVKLNHFKVYTKHKKINRIKKINRFRNASTKKNRR